MPRALSGYQAVSLPPQGILDRLPKILPAEQEVVVAHGDFIHVFKIISSSSFFFFPCRK